MRARILSVVQRVERCTRGLMPPTLVVLAGLFLVAFAVPPAAANGGKPVGGTPTVLLGAVAGLPDSGLVGDWTVAGVTVHVGESTTVDQTNGEVALGVTVQVRGTRQGDGSIDAAAIKVMKSPDESGKTIVVCGRVASLPDSGLIGDWAVNDLTVHVSDSTIVDQSKGTLAVNVIVQVKGTVQSDASIAATRITVTPAQCGAFNPPTALTFSVLHLTPTAAAAEGAEGVVLTRIMTFPDGSTRQDLKASVEHLVPNTAYEVMIDAIDAGPIMTNDDGEGMLFLSTADIPGAEPLPPDLQDFGSFVEADVNDSGGTTVLTGLFADAKSIARHGLGFDFLGVAILKDESDQVAGMATASIKESVQELSLGVWDLTPGEAYTLVVDGGTVGDLTASSRDRIEVKYSSSPEDGDLQLPDALMPVSGLMHLELRDSGGAAVVSGDFQAVTNPTAGLMKRVIKKAIHH